MPSVVGLTVVCIILIGWGTSGTNATAATPASSTAPDTVAIKYAGNHCVGSPGFATDETVTTCLEASNLLPTTSPCCQVFINSQDTPVFGICKATSFLGLAGTCVPCMVVQNTYPCSQDSSGGKSAIGGLCPVTAASQQGVSCNGASYPFLCKKIGASCTGTLNWTCCSGKCDSRTSTCF